MNFKAVNLQLIMPFLAIILQLMLSANAFHFQGCYSDSDGSILQNPSTVSQSFSDNLNSDCAEFCKDEGFAVSTTNGPSCYCTNTLPTPIIFSPGNPNAGGAGGRCVTPCPGTALAKYGYSRDCVDDECCGGPTAYSVYLVGSIDALLQLERRVVQGLMSNDHLLINHLFPEIGQQEIVNGWTQIMSDGSFTSGVKSFTAASGITGRQPELSGELVYEESYGNFYKLDVDFGQTCTITELSQRLTGQNSHTASLYFVYRNDEDVTIRYRHYGDSPIDSTTYTSDTIDGGLEGVRKLMLGYLGQQKLYLWEFKAKGTCNFGIDVVASGRTADKDGVQGIKTYHLSYNSYTNIEELSKTGVEPDVRQLTMKIQNMEKVLKYNDPVQEAPLGSSYECTLASGESDCWGVYTVSLLVGETFTTSAGINIGTTEGSEVSYNSLFLNAKNIFSLPIGYSLAFEYSTSETSSGTTAFRINSLGQAGERVLVFFTESYTPTTLSWRATISASGAVRVTINGIEKELDLTTLLTTSQRNFFALGSIDFEKQHVITSHVEVRYANGNLVNSDEEDRPVTTDAEETWDI